MDWKPFVSPQLRRQCVAIPGDATGGLPREAALEALEGFVDRDAGLLGGDVWAWDGSRFRPLGGAGWYVDRRPEEAWTAFRDRSIAVARVAVGRELSLQPGEQPLYVYVCTVEPEPPEHSNRGGSPS
jgi:hypothetical protein